MPERNRIFEQILRAKNEAQDEIRRQYLKSLQKYTNRDTIIYASAFTTKKLPNIPGYLVSITLDDVQGFMSALHGLKGKNLDLILHSPGGSLEAADQIVQYLRSKYDHIRAIVPQNAMSAAAMIACACDEILMGKHSAIGPIDPQITFPTQNGHFTAPAQSILDEFEEAKKEVVNDPRTAPLWVNKIKDYPPGFLNICQNTLKLSVDKVTEWLSTYMFKDHANPQSVARPIAERLGNAKEHKTHGRPITYKLAQDKGLNVNLIEDDQKLQEKVLSVYHSTSVTLEITNCMKFVENQNGKGWFLNVEIKQKG
jgi:hypothetical protein